MNEVLIWNKVLEELKSQLASLNYDIWFKNTKLYKLEDGKAYIIVEMPAQRKHISVNYNSVITSLLYDITNQNYELVILLEEELEEEKNRKIEEENILDNKSIDNDSRVIIEENHQSNLNPNLTFYNFVVGNSNKFAHATALSVAENPGKMYNPLFLYGNSGVGKTHLMHAIGNYIQENSNKKVLYITSEQFSDEFIKTCRKNENETNFNYVEFFKNKYRNIDVLIIDDIQCLGERKKSQQEFFHTFNNLFDDSKQIILSSDRSPDDLKQFEERLRTRFCWGLTVDISPPDYTLRVAILKSKIVAEGLEKDIPDDVIEYMATNIGPDVRSLIGAINRLVAYSATWGGAEIDLDLAMDALKDNVSKGISEKNDIQRIQRIVAEEFHISVDDMRSKKRNATISIPRQVAYYLCRNMTSESYPRIGIEFGGKDHTTVMYAVEKIDKEIHENPDLRNIIEKLKTKIGGVK